jgi:hypothetical protein
MGIFTANLIGWAVLISVLNMAREYSLIGLCLLAARNLFKRCDMIGPMPFAF